MKKLILTLLAIIVILLVVTACSPEAEGKDPYMSYPFSSNENIPKPSSDIEKFVGTYLYGPYNSVSYLGFQFVSFLENGTVVAFDYAPYSTSSTSEVRTGTWSISEGKLTTSFGNVTYTNAEMDYNTTSGESFRIKVRSYGTMSYHDVFLKESDSVVDASIYSNPSKIVGLWARTNDYGEVIAYRFTKDGYVYYYSSSKDVSKETWKLATTKTEIKMTTLDNDYSDTSSIFLCGDYLYIGTIAYKKMN